MRHLPQHGDAFHKPAVTRETLGRILGRGILVAEDAPHTKQRCALNPAFGPGPLRDLSGIFLDKANEVRPPSRLRCVRSLLTIRVKLRDVLDARIGAHASVDMDVMEHLSACTLDIIGMCGFGYAFDTLAAYRAPRELSAAFREVSAAVQDFVHLMLDWMFPFLRALVRALAPPRRAPC